MSNILWAIKKIAENEGITIGALERKIGASKGVLSRAMMNRTDIQAKWLEAIVDNYPIYSAEWLLTGKGNMLKSSEIQLATPEIVEQFPLRTDRRVEQQSVPLYDFDATAGLEDLFGNNARQIPVNYLQIPNLPPCSGAVHARGDSMYPLLQNGDIVLYKEVKNLDDILYGEMYLLSFTTNSDDYTTIKYIRKSDKHGCVSLESHNTRYSPKAIPLDSIRALALIKASVRYNIMG